MALFKITCRFTGAIRFEGEFGSLRLCVEAAVKARASRSACASSSSTSRRASSRWPWR